MQENTYCKTPVMSKILEKWIDNQHKSLQEL